MKSTSSDIWPVRVKMKDFTPTFAKAGEVNIAVISDVHLGHSRVWTSTIINVLEKSFTKERLETLRVIIISGDLFDKRLSFDSDDAALIIRWMERLCRAAKKYGIAIRILEGTPSHDNRQSRWMLHANEMIGAGADVKYYENIAIDEMYDGGPTVLYVQDEYDRDANKTWKAVQNLMVEKGIDQVDFGVMHGMFTFQEPVRSISSHLEERYEGIVKHVIIIGHHHKPAYHGKIRVPGSVERLRHNEEHDKGHYQFTYSPETGVGNEYFIINDEATTFMAFDVIGKSFNEVTTHLKKFLHYPDNSHFRLDLSRLDETYPALGKMKQIFPQFDITIKAIEAEVSSENEDHLIDAPILTSIRPDNLSELLMPRIQGASDAVLKRIAQIMAA